MQIKRYTSEYKSLWDNFVANSNNFLFLHHRDYMEYHAERFTDHSLLFFEDDKLIALLPLNIKDSVLYSHGGLTFGGFIVSSSMKSKKMLNCFDSLKEYMGNNHIQKLIYKAIPHIYHIRPAEDDIYALYRNSANLLKIEPTTAVFLKEPIKMPKGRKAQIARAKREGVIVDESMDFDQFFELENKILQERHNIKAVHTAEEMKKLQSYFPENIKLYTAIYQNTIIAGTIVYEYQNIIHTQYMAAADTAREVGALDLVIGSLIEQYTQTKRYFDFGISTEQNGMYLNEGLISQKEGFGGRTVVHQTWELKGL
jgi:hypothetical protein